VRSKTVTNVVGGNEYTTGHPVRNLLTSELSGSQYI